MLNTETFDNVFVHHGVSVGLCKRLFYIIGMDMYSDTKCLNSATYSRKHLKPKNCFNIYRLKETC